MTRSETTTDSANQEKPASTHQTSEPTRDMDLLYLRPQLAVALTLEQTAQLQM